MKTAMIILILLLFGCKSSKNFYPKVRGCGKYTRSDHDKWEYYYKSKYHLIEDRTYTYGLWEEGKK